MAPKLLWMDEIPHRQRNPGMLRSPANANKQWLQPWFHSGALHGFRNHPQYVCSFSLPQFRNPKEESDPQLKDLHGEPQNARQNRQEPFVWLAYPSSRQRRILRPGWRLLAKVARGVSLSSCGGNPPKISVCWFASFLRQTTWPQMRASVCGCPVFFLKANHPKERVLFGRNPPKISGILRASHLHPSLDWNGLSRASSQWANAL